MEGGECGDGEAATGDGAGAAEAAKAGSTRLTGMAGRAAGGHDGRGAAMTGELLSGVGSDEADAARLGKALGGTAEALAPGRGLATQARPLPPPPLRLRRPSAERLPSATTGPAGSARGITFAATAGPAARTPGTTVAAHTAAALTAKLLLTVPQPEGASRRD